MLARHSMSSLFAGSLCLALSILHVAMAGDDSFKGVCGVKSEENSVEGKQVQTKQYDCEGQCPVRDYGEKIFDQCCGRCQEYRAQGALFFGLCRGCDKTDTKEDIAAALSTGYDGRRLRSGYDGRRFRNESGAAPHRDARRLEDETTEATSAPLEEKTYTAECSAGRGGDGAVPPITVKVWPCEGCKEVPKNWRECCADCVREVESTEPPVFWQCASCDKYADRSKDIIKYVDSIVDSELSKDMDKASTRTLLLPIATLFLVSFVLIQ